MLTSNKILLTTLIVIFSAISICTVAMVIIFTDGNASSMDTGKETASTVSRDFEVKDFNGVSAGGLWQVEIVRSDSFALSVTAPWNVLNLVKPNVSGGILRLDQVPGADPRKKNCKAIIAMPDIADIHTYGSSSVSFSGFHAADISIKATEASRVTGSDSRVENLDCSAEHSSIVDLSACLVTNADFDASFAAKVTLLLSGGRVKGTVSASAEFAYLGEPGEMEIQAGGSSKILKKSVR